MKKISIILALFLITFTPGFSQLGINTDATAPDPSAMLDVKSTNSGILFPRLSETERNGIQSPATGLLIYNTTSNHFNYFDGSFWCQTEATFVSITSGLTHPGSGVSIHPSPGTVADSSAMLDIGGSGKGVLIPRTTPASITSPTSGLIIYNNLTNQLNYFDGVNWIAICGTQTPVAGSSGIQALSGIAVNSDGALPDQSAILDVSATDKGILIPRLTTEVREGIRAVTGLTIYNTSLGTIEFYNGTGWFRLNDTYVAAPTAAIHAASQTGIIWNWNAVDNVTGYKWNTANDYATAEDLGNTLTKTETGLTCNSAYSRFVWAYCNCGHSSATLLSQSTTNGGTISVTISSTASQVCAGTSVSFTATPVNGGSSPAFQWKKNRIDLSGATNASYVFAPAHHDTVTCVLTSNEPCAVGNPGTSNQLIMTVFERLPLSVVISPSVNPVCSGGNVIFTATVTNGGSSPHYQWQISNADITGATDNTYDYIPANGDVIACVVTATDSCTTNNPDTSNAVTMVVQDWQTVNVTIEASVNPVCEGNSITLTASPINGGASPTYQWKKSGIDIAGATNATYQYIPANNDQITCLLTSSASCVTGNPATSNLVAISVHALPGVPVEGTHTASANEIVWNWTAAPGAAGYRWNSVNDYQTAEDLGNLLTKTESGLSCGTLYQRYLWAYDTCGHSAVTTLNQSTPGNGTVNVAITVSSPIVCAGTTVTFTANGTNGGIAPQYQWRRNHADIIGATSSTFAYIPVNHDTISCIYTSNEPCVSGNPAKSNLIGMTVHEKLPVSVAIAASANPVCTGSSVLFTATPINGGANPAYQWIKGGTDITGATNSTYSYNPVNGDVIACRLTSSDSCTTGNPALSNQVTMAVQAYQTASVTVGASSNPVCTGLSVTFTATPANGGTAPLYQWKHGVTTISGATNSTYAYIPVNGDQISCVMTSNALCVNGNPAASNNITMSVTPVPGVPVSGTHLPTATQITWNWTTVSGATGYKWNSTNNFATAIDMGVATSKVQPGLTCNTNYTSYVWAYNSCGNSTPVTLTQSTSVCPYNCSGGITIDHIAGEVAPVNKTVTYDQVTSLPGEPSKCWISSNLGASSQATAVSDASENAAGWYWQFNRKQGYKHDGATLTPAVVWDVTNDNTASTWQASQDPCAIEMGTGWRIPTMTEWENVYTGGGWATWSGPWGSNLKLHAAGYLYYVDGTLYGRGANGIYWSSTQYNSGSAWDLNFNSISVYVSLHHKSYGFSIRCLKEM